MRKRIYQCHTPEDVTAAVDAFFEESLANAA